VRTEAAGGMVGTDQIRSRRLKSPGPMHVEATLIFCPRALQRGWPIAPVHPLNIPASTRECTVQYCHHILLAHAALSRGAEISYANENREAMLWYDQLITLCFPEFTLKI
jgi:hypothetical protein